MSGYHSTIENNRNCLRRIARHDEQQFSKDSLVNIMEKFVKTVNIMDETILIPCRLMDRQVGDSTDIIQAPAKTSTTSVLSSSGNLKKKHQQKTVHEFLNSADLFNLYTMLNSLKTDLLWTRSEEQNDNNDDGNESSTSTLIENEDKFDEQQQQQQQIVKSSTQQQTQQKGHVRRPSTASMASSNSVCNLSDSESEISNENDSGIESEGNCIKSSASSSSSDDGQQNEKQKQNLDKATELARKCRQHLSGLHTCLEQMTEAANYLTARYQSDIGPV